MNMLLEGAVVSSEQVENKSALVLFQIIKFNSVKTVRSESLVKNVRHGKDTGTPLPIFSA